jgi:Ricin-type beta-trefoil lectin domain-like
MKGIGRGENDYLSPISSQLNCGEEEKIRMKNGMKKIGLVASVALIFLVNGNLTFAQSLYYQAYELLNTLEYLFPQHLSPAQQMTRLDDEGAFNRHYFDAGITIKTKNDHLYIVKDGVTRDVGMIDDFWFPYAQSEALFNWLEQKFPEFLAPVPQATQMAGEIFYRVYPETNAMIGTLNGDLYFLDKQLQLYPLGRVNHWLGEILDFEEGLAGMYTIRQESSGRYVDAFETSNDSHDYDLVTRGPQNDDTQRWIIVPVGNNAYTIQQKSTMRYVELYHGTNFNLFSHLVTRKERNMMFQKWSITPLGNNVYTIQQGSGGAYVDAYENETSNHDYNLVLRGPQNDDTQKWIITLVPEDMEFLGIEYDLDEAEISTEPDPVVVATERLENNSPLEQAMSFEVEETYEEESYFEQTEGFEVQVGMELTAGVPYLQASTSIRISTDVHWTSGQSVVRSHAYRAVFPLRVEPYGVYTATARVWKSTLSVPYAMFFSSNETGAIRVSRGTWSGVSTWGLECVVTKDQK